MSPGKKPQRKIELPEGWFHRLLVLSKEKWHHVDGGEPSTFDIYDFCKVSERTFRKSRKTNKMTEQMFSALAEKIGYDSLDDLLSALTRGTRGAASVVPSGLTLTSANTRLGNQWADYCDLRVGAGGLQAVRCDVSTTALYFRFGLKLLAEDGRLFGDASIQSQDAELLVHVGRNDCDRPAQGLRASDVFFTWYANGIRIEQDRRLFSSDAQLTVSLELDVDRSYCARLSVNGKPCLVRQVIPRICRRVAVLAWGDGNPFSIDVTNLSIE